jgi:hypothetical protein
MAAEANETREPEHSVATGEAKTTHEEERSVNSAASSSVSGSSSATFDESKGESEAQSDTEYLVHSIVDRRPVWSGDEYEYLAVWWKEHGRMPRTWEPRGFMEREGFGEALVILAKPKPYRFSACGRMVHSKARYPD